MAKKGTAIRKKLDAAKALPGVVRRLLAISDPDELLAQTLAVCREALGADEVSLLLVDDDDLVEHDVVGKRLRKERYRVRIGEEGVTGISAAHRQPIIVSDVRKDRRYKKITDATRSEAAIPIVAGERLLGVLNFESSKIGFFSHTDRHLLELLASQIAIGLRLDEVHKLTERRAMMLGMLNNLGRAGTQMEGRAFLQRAVAQVRRTLESTYTAVLLADYARERVVLLAQDANTPERLLRTDHALPFTRDMTGNAARLGETLNARDVRKDPYYVEGVEGTRSEVVVPIRAGDRCLGILDVQSDQVASYDEDEVQALETLARFLVPVLQREDVNHPANA